MIVSPAWNTSASQTRNTGTANEPACGYASVCMGNVPSVIRTERRDINSLFRKTAAKPANCETQTAQIGNHLLIWKGRARGRSDAIRAEARAVLESFGAHPGHVFNLGHGITPDIDPAHVAVLVDAVHELSANRVRSVSTE